MRVMGLGLVLLASIEDKDGSSRRSRPSQSPSATLEEPLRTAV